MPSAWSRKKPKFLPSLVCFADILGFSDLTKEAIREGRGDGFLAHLTGALDRAYQEMRNARRRTPWFEMTVLTDNVVVAFPLTSLQHDGGEPELMMMFDTFTELQCMLALDGYFDRGAITYGRHYMDRNTAVGDALIEAVELEKVTGSPPRLVVSDGVKELIARYEPWYGNHGPPALDFLLEDPNDGKLFLHYLDQAFIAWPDGGIGFDVFTRHRDRVTENLLKYRHNDHVRTKYEWTANYHNFVCEDFARGHPISFSEYADEEAQAANAQAQELHDYLLSFRPTRELHSPRRVSPRALIGEH